MSEPDLGRVEARFDPVADIDMLGRKHPKRLGFLEVTRGLPWLLDQFTGRVPDEIVVVVGDGEVEVPCVCKRVTHLVHNIATPCEGSCGRWFWYIGAGVRVGYDPEEA